jgi:hypothetical protein
VWRAHKKGEWTGRCYKDLRARTGFMINKFKKVLMDEQFDYDIRIDVDYASSTFKAVAYE